MADEVPTEQLHCGSMDPLQTDLHRQVAMGVAQADELMQLVEGLAGWFLDEERFAALEDLSLAKVPAYVDFKLMFPGYIGKSKENIYCRYLGNAGKLRKSFRTSRKHISEVNSAVREFGSLLGIPIEKYLI